MTTYRVHYDSDDESWKVVKVGTFSDKTVRKYGKKSKAVKKARDYAKAKDAKLNIANKKGTGYTDKEDYRFED